MDLLPIELKQLILDHCGILAARDFYAHVPGEGRVVRESAPKRASRVMTDSAYHLAILGHINKSWRSVVATAKTKQPISRPYWLRTRFLTVEAANIIARDLVNHTREDPTKPSKAAELDLNFYANPEAMFHASSTLPPLKVEAVSAIEAMTIGQYYSKKNKSRIYKLTSQTLVIAALHNRFDLFRWIWKHISHQHRYNFLGIAMSGSLQSNDLRLVGRLCLAGHFDMVKHLIVDLGIIYSMNDAIVHAARGGHLRILEFLESIAISAEPAAKIDQPYCDKPGKMDYGAVIQSALTYGQKEILDWAQSKSKDHVSTLAVLRGGTELAFNYHHCQASLFSTSAALADLVYGGNEDLLERCQYKTINPGQHALSAAEMLISSGNYHLIPWMIKKRFPFHLNSLAERCAHRAEYALFYALVKFASIDISSLSISVFAFAAMDGQVNILQHRPSDVLNVPLPIIALAHGNTDIALNHMRTLSNPSFNAFSRVGDVAALKEFFATSPASNLQNFGRDFVPYLSASCKFNNPAMVEYILDTVDWHLAPKSKEMQQCLVLCLAAFPFVCL